MIFNGQIKLSNHEIDHFNSTYQRKSNNYAAQSAQFTCNDNNHKILNTWMFGILRALREQSLFVWFLIQWASFKSEIGSKSIHRCNEHRTILDVDHISFDNGFGIELEWIWRYCDRMIAWAIIWAHKYTDMCIQKQKQQLQSKHCAVAFSNGINWCDHLNTNANIWSYSSFVQTNSF